MDADQQARAWDAYFYPETIDPATGTGTLRNLYGLRDPNRLHAVEYRVVAARHAQLRDGSASIPRTYDAEHVRAIHRHLFQDVYEWAGQYRTVDMFKGRDAFAAIDGGIDEAIGRAREVVTGTEWASVSREEFGNRMGEVFTQINYAHPFREGNGRTTKVFLDQVAEQSPYRLNFSGVQPHVWNQISESTRRGGVLNPTLMQTLFQHIAERRPAPVRELKPDTAVPERKSLRERLNEKLHNRPTLPPKPDIDPTTRKGPKL